MMRKYPLLNLVGSGQEEALPSGNRLSNIHFLARNFSVLLTGGPGVAVLDNLSTYIVDSFLNSGRLWYGR